MCEAAERPLSRRAAAIVCAAHLCFKDGRTELTREATNGPDPDANALGKASAVTSILSLGSAKYT